MQSKSEKYYVSLCCRIENIPQFEQIKQYIGIDLGLKNILITSVGKEISKWIVDIEDFDINKTVRKDFINYEFNI